ncbi:MAG: acetylglutamate kinase [Gammaproteobacteria bacterium]|nr:acetylglutamate kinase [Gammaproteobacteria bacterium]MDE1984405.1 acetylglutamate kinase [Gammaproteobacteria bacterium]MDE2460458.1 acetylglutamate kinase [Gammaproteobacteria bacterium]
MSISPDSYASLRSAAQYVRAFRGKTFVFKLGGEVLEDPAVRRAVCEQLNVLWSFSIKLVIVHGGGTSLDALCESLALPVEKVAGRRVTTRQVLDAAKMVLAGSVHTDLLADLHAAGLPVTGVSGVDGGLLKARKRAPMQIKNDSGQTEFVDFGLVGDIEQVNPALLTHLLDGSYVPVVTPLSANDKGEVFNTNADTVAAEIALALKAEKLFFLLKVPGLLEDLSRPTSLVPYVTLAGADLLEKSGKVSGGMRPKLAAVKRALTGGVVSAHLVSGVLPDAVLTEVFTNQGSGSMIVARDDTTEEQAA